MEDKQLLDRFYRVLVDEIRTKRPDLLDSAFTVAEIYQDLVPYRTHRDRIGVEINGDYEHLLLRLLSGEGDYLILDSEVAGRELRTELRSPNPNTGVFRGFAAASVRLDPSRLPEPSAMGGDDTVPVESLAPTPAESTGRGDSPERAGEDVALHGAVRAKPSGRSDPAHDRLGGATTPPEPAQPDAAWAGVEGGSDTVPCRWCREELPRRDHLNFCPFCGTDVHVVPCPSCGEELEPSWRFCIACGTEVVGE